MLPSIIQIDSIGSLSMMRSFSFLSSFCEGLESVEQRIPWQVTTPAVVPKTHRDSSSLHAKPRGKKNVALVAKGRGIW